MQRLQTSHLGSRLRRGQIPATLVRALLVLCALSSLLGNRAAQAYPAAHAAPDRAMPLAGSISPPAPVHPDAATAISSAISQPSLTLSTTAAGASAVTYTIGFSIGATGAIPSGGTITLVAPPGTLWPPGTCSYVLTDATTASGSFSCAQSVQTAAPGLPIYNFLNRSGTAVTVAVPNAIKAGDALSLAVSGVANPGAGSDTLTVFTSADPAPATSASYTITAPRTVGQPSVSLSTTAAGASAVTYTIGFSTSATGAIPVGGTITLVAPPGTLWPSGTCSYVLTDATTASGSFPCAQSVQTAAPGLPIYNFLSGSGAAVTIVAPNAIKAGDALSLVVSGVANPGVGSDALSVFTSGDPAPVASAPYTIAASSAVSQPSVSLSSTAAGASAVTYTIGFSASATGAIPSGGTITLVAPPSTVWPGDRGQYALTDSTTPSGSTTDMSGVQVAAGGTIVSIVIPNAIRAGDALSLAVGNVTNAGAGSYSLAVFTAADPRPATSASFTLTGATASTTSVSGVSLSLSTTAAGANGVTYTVGFTTSSAAGEILGGSGTITLAAPAGTIFGACPYGCGGGNATYTITDLTHPAGSGGAGPVAIAAGGAVVSIMPANTIQAGDQITLTITQVTNPPAAGTIAVSTSSDSTPVGISDSISAAKSISSPSLSLSTTASGANGVTYTVGFTVSSTGALEGGLGAITLAAPAGTIFGACPYGCGGGNATYTITDLTHPSGSGGAGPVAIVAGSAVVSIVPANTIQAGDQITLTITQVTNPPAGASTIAVSTSSDSTPVGVSDPISAANPVSSPPLALSNTVAGATGVTYTVGFTASSTGQLLGGLGAITLAAPAGTIFSPTGQIRVTDVTTPSGSGTGGGANVIGGGSIISFVLPQTIKVGDVVAVDVGGVTNPSATGAQSLTISSSSDTIPAVLGYTLVQGTSISGNILANGGGGASTAALQACTASAACTYDVADGSGNFTLYVVAGTYTLTAFPPAGSRDSAATATFTVGSTPLSGLTLHLGPPPTLAAGITLVTAGGATETSSTANPVVNWGSPFQLRIDPSMFPSGRIVVATQVVINGTNLLTGLPANKIVNIGGTVGGNPTGIVVGSSPIIVNVPPLAPIHGQVAFTVNYQSYPTGSPVPYGSGLASTQVLDLIYPNAPPQAAPTDPLPAYFTNVGDPPGISVGGGTIVGPDTQYFSVVPLSSYGVPPGTTDCGSTPAQLQQFDGFGEPTPANECGIAVLFTPPPAPQAKRIFYYATLEVNAGPFGGVVPVSLVGCDDRVAQEAGLVTGTDPCSVGGGDDDNNGGVGDGASGGSSSGGGEWIDPSGTVSVTDGHTPAAPLAGATVTLGQGATLAGPFSPVPNGSVVMSPANRVNPGITDAQGGFGWDVLAGFYQVTATSPGCSTASTPGLAIPPPVTGLSLTVTCPTMPARNATQVALSTSSANATFGQPVTFTALVTGSGTPVGTVIFLDGTTPIGTGVLDQGTATLTLGTLPSGSHSITASYGGDATDQPATSPSITQIVTLTVAIAASPGWNLIDLPLTATSSISASTVLAGVLQSGGQLAALYELNHNQWTPSLIAQPGKPAIGQDFALQAGVGYLLYSDLNASYRETGTVPVAPPTWSLSQGWNLVGLAFGATGVISASTVLTKLLQRSGGQLAALYELNHNQWTPSLIRLGSGAQVGHDFALAPGTGYLLYSDTTLPGGFTPSASVPAGGAVPFRRPLRGRPSGGPFPPLPPLPPVVGHL